MAAKDTGQLLKLALLNTTFELYSYVDKSSLYPGLDDHLKDEQDDWMIFWKEMEDFEFQCGALFSRLPSSLASIEKRYLHEQPGENVQESSKPAELYLSVKQSLDIDGLLKKCEEITQKLLKWEVFGYQIVPRTNLFRNVFIDMLCYKQELTTAAEQMELLWKRVDEQEDILPQKAADSQTESKDLFCDLNKMNVELQNLKNMCVKSSSSPEKTEIRKGITAPVSMKKGPGTLSDRTKAVLDESSFNSHCGNYSSVTSDYLKMDDLYSDVSKNPWLSLPLADFTKSSEKAVPWLHINKASSTLENALIQAKEKCKVCCCDADVSVKSSSIETHTCNENVKATTTHQDRGVQTEDLPLMISDIYSRTYALERDDSLLGNTFNERDETDNRQSIVWDSYDLHLSRRMVESNYINELLDWELKEQEELCRIEKLLNNAEAILKEEEVALKEEQEFENLLREKQHPTYYVFSDDLHEEKTSFCQETTKELLTGAMTGAKYLSSTPNVKASNGWRKWDSPMSIGYGSISEDSGMKAQTSYIDLYRELKEIHAIENCIFEENKKLKEFHELEHSEAVKEHESLFNHSIEKLSFLTRLQRERIQVDEMEKSLAKEEAKKQKCLRRKMERARIKKYCQDFFKENISLISAYEHFPEKSAVSIGVHGLEWILKNKIPSFQCPVKDAKSGTVGCLLIPPTGDVSNLPFRQLLDGGIVEGSEITSEYAKPTKSKKPQYSALQQPHVMF